MAKRTPQSITAPKGFAASAGAFGIKASGNPDLTLIVADHQAAAAGVFTRNKVVGAPVTVSKRHLRGGRARAIVVNAGNSNVATGQQGIADAEAMCAEVARLLPDCKPADVLVCSTGVIGHPLPIDKITRGIATLGSRLAKGTAADDAAATAILTTDLTQKTSLRRFMIAGKRVTLGGIAKGSGMIQPNMATMLAFLTTDLSISPKALQQALKVATSRTFNRISVDHDTSTSDSVMILASGDADNAIIDKPAGDDYDRFLQALTDVCGELAYAIIKDGEGATRVFRVCVRGAKSEKQADLIGYAVVGSPLVKSAVHGGDPNWGRLLMAVGRSGADVKAETLQLHIGGIHVYDGRPLELTPAAIKKLVKAMTRDEVVFELDLRLGQGEAQWLGCDLSRQYVTINADYTT